LLETQKTLTAVEQSNAGVLRSQLVEHGYQDIDSGQELDVGSFCTLSVGGVENLQ
jgi:hypothetical protein